MATTGNLDNKPVLVSEMRGYVGNISAHARGGNTLKATKTGAMVSVDDAYAGSLLKLTAYGNSIQDGTPTPDAPVEIKSVAGIGAHTSGKNLFCAAGITKTNHGISYIYDGTGAVKLSGTSNSTSGVAITDFISSHQTIELEPGSHTLSITQTSGNVKAQIYDANTVTSIGSTTTSQTFRVNANRTVVVRAQVDNGVTIDETVYIQLEKGSTATAWEPAGGSYSPLTLVDSDGNAHELRSLPDGTRDELVINADGSGTVLERVGSIVFDGSSGAQAYSSSIDNVFYGIVETAGTGEMLSMLPRNACRASQYVAVDKSFSEIGNGECTIRYNSSGSLLFYYRNNSISSASDMLTFLQANPMDIKYRKRVDGVYHIPAINMPALPDLVSNCWLSATDANGDAIPCEVGIEYRRDINKVIEDIETAIADIVSA